MIQFNSDDYEDDILEKLNEFFEESGEIVSEETLEELALIIYRSLNQ